MSGKKKKKKGGKEQKEMFVACAHGDKEKIKELFTKHGQSLLDCKEPTKGTTPLHFGVIAGKSGVVKTLIKLGCDINATVCKLVSSAFPSH